MVRWELVRLYSGLERGGGPQAVLVLVRVVASADVALLFVGWLALGGIV
ncbi:MAG: hypothetical protein K8963_01995 [Proteobacteria bacterium]|nr:hypothetical protein [Pseudomonadota bacterium]